MNYTDHFAALRNALITERDFETKAYQTLIQNRSIKERVEEGVTWYPVDYTDYHYSRLNELVLVFRINEDQHGKMFGTSGKCSIFSSVSNEKTDGIILQQKDNVVSVVIDEEEIPEWLKEGKIGIDAICDTRTYDLQIKAMEDLAETKRGIAVDFYTKKAEGFPPDDFHEDPNLNNSQNIAVKEICSTTPVTIVHGPPGTGKTKTLVSAIKNLYREGKKILVAAPTNAAADHITSEIAKAGVEVLRYGNSFKISPQVFGLTLQSRIQNHSDLQVVERLTKDAEAIRKKAFRFVRNFGPEEQAERRELKNQLREIRKDIRLIEKRVRAYTLEKYPVITGTLIGLQQEEISQHEFEIMMVDEAGQALESAIWSLCRHAKKLVMAGDPFQLSPVLFSDQAQKSPLSVSLIETGMKLNQPCFLLNTQYRMNDLIMQFSNSKFYENKLVSGEAVKNQTLKNETYLPVEFLDTAGCGYEEKRDENGGISNPEEAELLTKRYLELNTNNLSVGIISPYRAQVNLLKSKIENTHTTIETVDSFQGQERDIILISLVRSNTENEIGFLKDYRRMNVAMTRARFKLIIIGDSSTTGSDPFYSDLLEYAEKNGSYRSGYEYFE